MLEGVVFKKLLVEFPADLGEDDLFGVGRVGDRDAVGGEPGFHFPGGGGAADELLERVEVDREAVVAPVGVGEDAVVDGMPVGELGEVVADFL